jgi:AraC family transcriptional regulator, regulatory protein of adaptative response / methylated-DNA-[protein]-cysteine methyltransferase
MKTLPPPSEMYRALVARDGSFDGSFFAGIRTTGIFCRPGCGARKPRPENVEYFRSAAEAERRGYRACLRCRPLEPALATPAWAKRLLALAASAGSSRLSAEDLRAHGIDPARASRFCRERFGTSFQAWMRSRRLAGAFERIQRGVPVSEVALESGFESESGFRDAFVRLFGVPPTRAKIEGRDVLRVSWITTPLGPMLAAAGDGGVCLLEFADRRALRSQIATLRRHFPGPVVAGTNEHLEELAAEIEEYFAGRRSSFEVTIVRRGTPFQEAVWERLCAIPAGETRSYAGIAREIGRPSAVRAVARANGENRLAILVPCHRVIGSDGSPTGYGGGVWRKEWLLTHEREHAGAAQRP